MHRYLGIAPVSRPMSYVPSSYGALAGWVMAESGSLVSPRQIAFITADPRFDARVFRQYVSLPDGRTLLVHTALHAPAPLIYKVYFHAIIPNDGSVVRETLDKHRPDHHVRAEDLPLYPWWTSSVLAPY